MPFIYSCRKVAPSGAVEYQGVFQSELVLKTFAWHLALIGESAGYDKQQGALALCTMAVERALHMWYPGQLDLELPGKFSEAACGTKSLEYLHLITSKVADSTWKIIMKRAAKFNKDKKEESSSINTLLNAIRPESARVNIVDIPDKEYADSDANELEADVFSGPSTSANTVTLKWKEQ
ncbi:hypothetical protein EW026_g8148 [Hermanssonia centrifuga]|uniref:Uncharacterized protein n=1 Tax=Hermanssonia centrifuga TaxID=98765 RepID=A0A4S4K5C3_9APHY|nr:hypothetical protein EW026_g8148 [Hermanssonia centrifuga]